MILPHLNKGICELALPACLRDSIATSDDFHQSTAKRQCMYMDTYVVSIGFAVGQQAGKLLNSKLHGVQGIRKQKELDQAPEWSDAAVLGMKTPGVSAESQPVIPGRRLCRRNDLHQEEREKKISSSSSVKTSKHRVHRLTSLCDLYSQLKRKKMHVPLASLRHSLSRGLHVVVPRPLLASRPANISSSTALPALRSFSTSVFRMVIIFSF